MTTRRSFVVSMLALLAPATSPTDDRLRTGSIEEARAAMCLEIRTDPEVALDTAIFVDQWRRELGRIIDLGSVSPFSPGVDVRERSPPDPAGDC